MQRTVTSVENINTKKSLVHINEDMERLPLYNSRLKKYNIEPGADIPEEVYEELVKELYERGVNYCLHLISAKDYSEGEIRQKLSKAYYPDKVQDSIVDFLKSKRFICDERFIKLLAEEYSLKYGPYKVEQKLYSKGFSPELIKAAVEEIRDESSEEELIKELLKQKRFSYDEDMTREERYKLKSKMCRFLASRGFSFDTINRVLSDYE